MDEQTLEFDTIDLLLGFGIAASASAGAYPATACLVGLFVAQKTARTTPEVRALVSMSRQVLSSHAERVRALLPQMASLAAQQAPQRQQEARPPAGGLLEQLEAAPHLLVIGHSRGGKTTLIHELAQRRVREGARVVVGDPDAAPGVWPGCRVYGAGDRFDQISQMLDITGQEVARRRQQRAEGQRQFKPVYVVLDEVQDTLVEVPAALPVVETLARRGAKLNMHLVLGVQDKQVKTLGLEGKSALLNNLLVADVYKDQRSGQRVARLRYGDDRVTLPIPQLPDPERLVQAPSAAVSGKPAKMATPVQSSTAAVSNKAVDPLLATLLNTGIAPSDTPTIPHRTDTATIPSIAKTDTPDTAAVIVEASTMPGGVSVVFADTGAVPGTSITLVLPKDGELDRYSRIKGLVALGVSATKIRGIVGGNNADIQASVKRAKIEMGLAETDEKGEAAAIGEAVKRLKGDD